MTTSVARRKISMLYRSITLLALCGLLCMSPASALAHTYAQLLPEELIQRLTDVDPTIRLDAAYQLGELGFSDAAITAALVAATDDADTEVRVVVAFALGKSGFAGETVLAALSALLQDEEPTVRYSAARALGFLGPTASAATAALLTTITEDDDGDVRYAATVALSRIGADPTTALDPLVAALDDPHWYARKAAAAALATIPSAATPRLAKMLENPNTSWEVYNEIVDLAPAMHGQWMGAIAPLLASPNADITTRMFGSIVLQQSTDEHDLAHLYKTLAAHPFTPIREEAIAGLGYLGESQRPQLLRLLLSNTQRIRQAALSALLRMGSPTIEQTVTYLVTNARSDTPEMQTRALTTLSAMGANAAAATPALLEEFASATDENVTVVLIATLAAIAPPQPDVLPTLLEIAQDATKSNPVRLAAIKAISAYGRVGNQAVTPLLALLTPANPSLQSALVDAVGIVGGAAPPVLDALIALSTDSAWEIAVRQRAIQQITAMAQLAAPATPALQSLLDAAQPLVIRKAALTALAAIGPQAKQAIPTLVALFADADVTLAQAAATTVGAIGEPALPTLIHLLRADQPVQVQEQAAAALAKVGTAAVPSLTYALGEEAPEVRQQIVAIFTKIGPSAVNGFLAALQDPDDTVRSAAKAAVDTLFKKHLEDGSVKVTGGFAVVEAIPLLLAALQLPGVDQQQQAAAALGFIGPPAAIAAPRLGMALLSDDSDLSCTAALALIYIGPSAAAAAPYVSQALATQHPAITCTTEKAFRLVLSRRPHQVQSARLIALSLLNQEETNRQLLLIETLTLFGGKNTAAVSGLIDLLQGETQRRYAAEALRQIGSGAAPALAQIFTSKATESSGQTAAIAEALQGKGNDLRRSAIYALSTTEPLPVSVRADLQMIVADEQEDPAIRSMAATVLQEYTTSTQQAPGKADAAFLQETTLMNLQPVVCPYWPTMRIENPPIFDVYWDECLYAPPNKESPTINQIYQAIIDWLGGG